MAILAELHACAPFEEKVGGRPAQLKENLEGEINNKGDVFLLEEQHGNFVAAVRK